jgi:ribulose 1,5-bisphosphate synthetase/thiazole synthase
MACSAYPPGRFEVAFQFQVSSNTYDAVIVGGGHYELVVAYYLARAGYSVSVLERYV